MSSSTQRILAGAGALMLFGALFALPVFAAMSLCTMPCCHHNGGGAPVLALDMSGCMPQCSVRTEEATPATVRTMTPSAGQTMSVAHAALPATIAAPPSRSTPPIDSGPPRCAAAPVHVLNSVFRI